jgi:hypothetical protein
MDERGPLLGEIRRRRRQVAELIGIAALLGLLVNLAASALFSFFSPIGSRSWHGLLFYAALLLAALLTVVGWLLFRETAQSAEIEIVIPLLVGTEHSEVKPLPGYAASRFASIYLTRRLRRDAEFRKRFLDSWRENDPLAASKLPSFARTTLHQLVERILLALLGHYGQHTLEPGARFHAEYRHLAGKFQPVRFTRADLPEPLRQNPFLPPPSDDSSAQFRFPRGVKFAVAPPGSPASVSQAGLALVSPWGSIGFHILPDWVRLHKEQRRFRIFARPLRGVALDHVHFLQIPVCVELRLRGTKLFSRAFEDHYLWMQGLLSDARRFLDAAAYEDADLERKVVEIQQGLLSLRKAPTTPPGTPRGS